jgi:hypothetical protein
MTMNESESPSKPLAELTWREHTPIEYCIALLFAKDFCHCSAEAG